VHKGSNLCTVTGSTFTSNTASDGGGAIFNNQTTNVKPLTITNCIFNGNSAINAGGAIENDNTAVLNVNNSNFTGNKATAINGFGGGAIYNGDGSSLTPTSSIFINDASPYGGAIENYYGTITLQYNQIAGNTLGNEGTIYNNGGSGYASPNWWGQNSGPITGDIVGQGITVTNWLVLKLSANPTTIGNYAHSNIMADLRYDNYGNYVSGGVVPNGIPVTFTTNLGTISQASTVNGVATATLTTSLTIGSTTIDASEIGVLDSATAGTVIANKVLIADSNKNISGLAGITLANTSPASVVSSTFNSDTYIFTHGVQGSATSVSANSYYWNYNNAYRLFMNPSGKIAVGFTTTTGSMFNYDFNVNGTVNATNYYWGGSIVNLGRISGYARSRGAPSASSTGRAAAAQRKGARSPRIGRARGN